MMNLPLCALFPPLSLHGLITRLVASLVPLFIYFYFFLVNNFALSSSLPRFYSAKDILGFTLWKQECIDYFPSSKYPTN